MQRDTDMDMSICMAMCWLKKGQSTDFHHISAQKSDCHLYQFHRIVPKHLGNSTCHKCQDAYYFWSVCSIPAVYHTHPPQRWQEPQHPHHGSRSAPATDFEASAPARSDGDVTKLCSSLMWIPDIERSGPRHGRRAWWT